jgi:hypothetical protein
MLATCLQRMRTRLSTDSPSHACTAVRAVCPAGKGMATAPTLTLDLIVTSSARPAQQGSSNPSLATQGARFGNSARLAAADPQAMAVRPMYFSSVLEVHKVVSARHSR